MVNRNGRQFGATMHQPTKDRIRAWLQQSEFANEKLRAENSELLIIVNEKQEEIEELERKLSSVKRRVAAMSKMLQ